MSKIDIINGWAEKEEVRATDAQVQAALEQDGSLIEMISEELESDSEDDSDRLLRMYLLANEHEKATIDGVLTCITGWTMKSLLTRMGITEENK